MADDKKRQLKARFRQMDKNGDNKLDFNEFLGLMQGLDSRTAHRLFDKCDTTGDGTIDFDEFVDYIYSTEKRSNRTTEGRHARLVQANAVNQDSEDAALWDSCRAVYQSYSGLDERFEGKDFMNLCKQCKLFDRKFTRNDVDIIFAKHKTRGKNTINFDPEFQNCIRGVAQKKGIPTSAVQAAVAERQEVGVEQTATKADYVKFHDDKTTYTGAHVYNENHAGAGSQEHMPGAREERIRASEHLSHEGQQELPWDGVEAAFYAFCKGDQYLDGREFNQLCADCRLFSNRFTTADADIIFNKVKNRGERKIDYGQFQDACIGVANKRGSPVSEVQRAIMDTHGPSMHGVTQADKVRFHDDKSLYTGMHANNEHHNL